MAHQLRDKPPLQFTNETEQIGFIHMKHDIQLRKPLKITTKEENGRAKTTLVCFQE